MNGRTRFTDTFTATLVLTLGSTVLFGNPTDTVAHWTARIMISATVSWFATGAWYSYRRTATENDADSPA
jgi:hypothetical protein